jgi:hypothetical protein
MSEYAPVRRQVNPLFDPIVYFRVTAWALGLIALLGVISTAMNQEDVTRQFLSFGGTFLQFTWWHNYIHIALAAACALLGYASLPGQAVKMSAIAFGAVYLILGVLGFFLWNTAEDPFLALTMVLNAVHLLLGAWALAAGLLSPSYS